MKSTDDRKLFGTPIGSAAAAGNIATIPQTQAKSGDGTASVALGFPPETFVARAAGGAPPRGQDMNGLLNLLSSAVQVLQAGFVGPFDAGFAQSVGGYPAGAVVAGALPGTFWVSTADANLATPGAQGAAWKSLFEGYATQIWVDTRLPVKTAFTVNGTFTVPEGHTHLTVTGVGGGGGGGSGGMNVAGGNGGGSGQYVCEQQFSVAPGDVLSIAIGAGGAIAQGGNNAGGDGGKTVLVNTTQQTTLLTLSGGMGGSAGGGGSSGQIYTNGFVGYANTTLGGQGYIANGVVHGGDGAGSAYGGGGVGALYSLGTPIVGVTAQSTAYGVGGGGGVNSGEGGLGCNGILVLETAP